jgi:hypothetical protein
MAHRDFVIYAVPQRFLWISPIRRDQTDTSGKHIDEQRAGRS